MKIKKILLSLSILMLLFSSTFAIEENPQLEIDNSDFIVESSLFQKLTLDATSSGVLSGNPDEEKQYKLKSGVSEINYPQRDGNYWVVYEYLEPKCNDKGGDFFGDFIQLNIMTSCDPNSPDVIMTLQKTNKVYIEDGKDSSGSKKLDVSKDYYSGVTHINVKIYFVTEEEQSEEKEQVEAKWLNYYTCGVNNFEYRMYQNKDGSQVEKQFKQCEFDCIDLGTGVVSCLNDEKIIDNNGDNKADVPYNNYEPTVPEIPTPVLNYDPETGSVKTNGTTVKVCSENEDLVDLGGSSYICTAQAQDNDTTNYNILYGILAIICILVLAKLMRWF